MKDRIRHIMKEENLSNTRLAEILEVQPSAVSHLLGGRNKPSYDMIVKIMQRFPQISPDWLLLGEGKPYRLENGLFENTQEDDPNILFSEFKELRPSQDKERAQGDNAEQRKQDKFTQNEPISRTNARPLRIVIFYDNGTCESYNMNE